MIALMVLTLEEPLCTTVRLQPMQSHPGQGHKLDSLMIHLVAFYDMQDHSSIHSHVCPRYRAKCNTMVKLCDANKKFKNTKLFNKRLIAFIDSKRKSRVDSSLP